MNLYYYYALQIDVKLYWRKTLKCLMAALPAFAVGFVICRVLDTYKMIYLLLGIVLYALAYGLCIFAFATTKEEKTNLTGMAKKKIVSVVGRRQK